jgi:putative transposase
MALDLRTPGWGRDKLEHLFLSSGYRVIYPPKQTRTTFPQLDVLYPDLIAGMELNNINQVVQTDITYYRVGERFYYLVFLIDVYSRRIVGYSVNRSLHAEGNMKALKMLLQTRKGTDVRGLIHHCDRGRQHVDHRYIGLLEKYGIKLSMCKEAWQNAYTERLNRTIKRDYLDWWHIATVAELRKCVRQAVYHYNHKKKHEGLGGKSPIEFEKYVEKLKPDQMPKEQIYNYLEVNPQKACEY